MKGIIQKIGVLLLLVLCCSIPQQAKACNYYHKMRNFNKAVDKYNDLVNNGGTPQQIAQAALVICRIRKNIDYKFKNRTNKPTPDPPSGIDCEALLMSLRGGGGRGGSSGGAGSPGSSFAYYVWLRNHGTSTCDFSWSISSDSVAVAGISFSKTSGTVSVPEFSNGATLIPLTVSIDANVPAATKARYTLEITDNCTGLPISPEYGKFEIVVTQDVVIEVMDPIVPVPNATPVTVTWRLHNPTSNPITTTYSFGLAPDPLSIATTNQGFNYPIVNAIPADKSILDGTVTIPANGFIDVDWDLNPTDYCDPEMLGCCSIEIDDVLSCIMTPMDVNANEGTCNDAFQLVGEAQGGFLQLTIENETSSFPLQLETFPGFQIENILDQFSFLMLEYFFQNNEFNYQPIVTEDDIIALLPPNVVVIPSSNDAGLNWLTNPCDSTILDSKAIESAMNETTLHVYPNLVKQDVRLLYVLPEKTPITLSIIDVSGRVVKQIETKTTESEGIHAKQLDLSDLRAGIYFTVLQTDDVVITEKIVKM